MDQSSWVLAYFSPTGTTVKLGRTIARSAGGPVREVDLSAPVQLEILHADDVLLVCVPVFGGRVPTVALERLAAVKGTNGKAVAVVVYGNRAYDDALLELKDTLEKQEFQVIAAGSFVAEHSIIRSIAAGRPDSHDLDTAARFGLDVMKKLSQSDNFPIHVPGNPGYRENTLKGSSSHPKADERCVACGFCAERCPAGAISPEKPGETKEDRCINCMRCVSICPQGARSLPAPMLAAVEEMLKRTAASPRQAEIFL